MASIYYLYFHWSQASGDINAGNTDDRFWWSGRRPLKNGFIDAFEERGVGCRGAVDDHFSFHSILFSGNFEAFTK